MTTPLDETSVAILAGGLAARLRPITERIPKSLVTVCGRPFIDYQLEELRRQGLRKVVLCVGHLGEQMEAAVGDGGRFGLEVRYAWDGPTQRGTGGALAGALPLLSENFFCLYGDSLLQIDYAEVRATFERAQQPALMTVFRNAGAWDTSNVLYESGRIVRYSKTRLLPEMAHIDYGLSILSKSLFDFPGADAAFDLAPFLEALAEEEKLAAYESSQRFYEIGSSRGITELEAFLTAAASTQVGSR